jgi:putative iron-regulated protein
LTQEAAKTAWKNNRLVYQQTEALRFSDGPIDGNDEGLPEIRINAWPLDENYIDYTSTMANAGLINDTSKVLTKQMLSDANMVGKPESVSTGYHAIEFLLWGQDLTTPGGAGARPFTDFVTGGGGTAQNQERRRQYLSLVAELLVDDLTTVRDAWAPGSTTNYAAEFNGLEPKEALRRILSGMGVMASSELSGERMLTAYENKDQEDEHSCFSDTTLDDLIGNMKSIENLYLGRYGSNDGPGIDTLVLARDPALDATMKTRIAAALAALDAIPGTFDEAILGADTTDGRMKVNAAIDAVRACGDTLGDIAALFDIEIVIE